MRGGFFLSRLTLRIGLIPKSKPFFALAQFPATRIAQVFPDMSPAKVRRGFRAFAIGVSAGGPQALMEVVSQLPANLPVPVLVVQHMLPSFTRFLAERLRACSRLGVDEAVDGMVVAPGRVIVALALTCGSAAGARSCWPNSARIRRRTSAVPPWMCCFARSPTLLVPMCFRWCLPAWATTVCAGPRPSRRWASLPGQGWRTRYCLWPRLARRSPAWG